MSTREQHTPQQWHQVDAIGVKLWLGIAFDKYPLLGVNPVSMKQTFPLSSAIHFHSGYLASEGTWMRDYMRMLIDCFLHALHIYNELFAKLLLEVP